MIVATCIRGGKNIVKLSRLGKCMVQNADIISGARNEALKNCNQLQLKILKMSHKNETCMQQHGQYLHQ